MAHYDVKILESLLDSYERSLLSKGKNKVMIHIAFPFTKKTIPEYFNESSLAYDEIHGVVKELEQRGFLEIVWKKGKEGAHHSESPFERGGDREGICLSAKDTKSRLYSSASATVRFLEAGRGGRFRCLEIC